MGNTLLRENASSFDSGEYYCMAYTLAGNVTSDVITVTVYGLSFKIHCINSYRKDKSEIDQLYDSSTLADKVK